VWGLVASRSLVIVVVLVVAALVAGCGSRGGEGNGGGAIDAVATTTQTGDLLRQVGGDRVGVTQILQPNSDPHDYEPRPSDARAVERADLVVRSGGAVDDWMGDLIDTNGGDAQQADLIRSVRARGGDPHWWQDPRNAERAVSAIRDALIEADPGGRAGYGRRAAAYTKHLRALDRDVAACIGRLPRERRKLVTSHDALGYYTSRYGLTLVGAVIPSLSSQAQPSSRDINRLVGQIRRERVRAIFPESSLNPKLEKAIAREAGARVGGALWADTLGPEGSRGATYIGSVEDNTRTIVRGLSGAGTRCAFSGS
jgi:ABC-type Zn uptake system ZnuABC Zn-binding protein ZnuA